MNLSVMSEAIAGPAISGSFACWMVGAKAATLPLLTVPTIAETLSLLMRRWTSETARCGLASSL